VSAGLITLAGAEAQVRDLMVEEPPAGPHQAVERACVLAESLKAEVLGHSHTGDRIIRTVVDIPIVLHADIYALIQAECRAYGRSDLRCA
jgi:hypothetical protein